MQLIRAFLLLISLSLPAAALAEEVPMLDIELNAADTLDGACRLTFVLKNGLEDDIDELVAETVLFSDEGQVVLLTLFNFGALPAGRPRVRQFQVPDTSCDRIGQVLVNGMNSCRIGGTDVATCQNALNLSNRIPIRLDG